MHMGAIALAEESLGTCGTRVSQPRVRILE
jgi:hypothetical protein